VRLVNGFAVRAKPAGRALVFHGQTGNYPKRLIGQQLSLSCTSLRFGPDHPPTLPSLEEGPRIPIAPNRPLSANIWHAFRTQIARKSPEKCNSRVSRSQSTSGFKLTVSPIGVFEALVALERQ
jgi:hypothetical protein